MPDQVTPQLPGGKNELSMEARLLIAFLLMGVVLFVTPYFYKPSAPAPKGVANVTPQKAAQVTQPPPAATTPPPPAASAGQVRGDKEDTFTVDTKLYRVVLSNKGANIRSWQLKQYKDLHGQPLELNAIGNGRLPAPFSIDFKDRKPDVDLNQVLWVARPTADRLGIDYEFSDGRVSARKSFHFAESYLSRIASEVSIAGASVPHLLTWRGGFGDPTVQNAPTAERAIFYDLSASKLINKGPDDAKNGPVSWPGTYSFAGLEDTFFTAVALPQGTGNFEVRAYSDSLPYGNDNKSTPFIGVGLGGDGSNNFELFVGPKDTDILRKVNPKLEQVINWGFWLGWLAKPLFLALNWVNDTVTHNYGWAIVLVTLSINILLFPLRLTGMKNAKKMQALQPEIQAINARYKNLSLRDPKQSEKNAEVMALYSKNGVNPLSSGCMPLLFQFPFLFSFYTVLGVAIEMRGAPWLWVTDLSRPEQLAIRVLPLVMIATQFISQQLTPAAPGMDPAQQKMMKFMPLFFGFMFYYQSAGLVLYWLTGNVVGIVQQWFMNRATAPASPGVVDVKPVRKK